MIINGKYEHEKMLNITDHQWNINYNTKDSTTHPLERLESRTRTNPDEGVGQWGLSLLVARQNGTASWEDSLAVSYNTKHTLTIWSLDCIVPLSIYPKELKIDFYTKPYAYCCWISFIHNCQNLEATRMSFSRWMDK